jgi:hypothetical protein
MRIQGYEYKTDFLRRAFADGKAEGARGMLVAILEGRGFAPQPEHLQRIEACSDEAQLEGWAKRALVVERIDDLFG